MISLHIEAESPSALRDLLQQMLDGHRATVTGDANVAEAKPTRKPRKAKDEEPDEAPSAEGKPDANPSGDDPSSEDATSSETPSSAADDEQPVTEAALRARATRFTQKAGPIPLVEMQKLAGAPNGKMSEILADPALMAKMSVLLADAGY
jgi:hypothetical protein